MRSTRLLGAAAAAAIIAAPLAASAAAADDPVSGIGTGTVSSSVLDLSVGGGDVLVVRLLGNDITSTTEGDGSAATTLSPINVGSGVAAPLNVAAPTVSTSSSGAEDRTSHDAAIPVIAGFAGNLSAALSSVVDAAGARSSLGGGVTNLSLAGGLARVPQAVVDTSTDAAIGQTVSTYSLEIPSATVLDLSAVLSGLGLDLDDLSLEALLDLLDDLGLPLSGVVDPDALVADLNEAITTLEGTTGPITAELCATVDGILGGTLDTIGGTVDKVIDDAEKIIDEGTKTVTDTVDDTTKPVTDTLGGDTTGTVDKTTDTVDGTVDTTTDTIGGTTDGVTGLLSAQLVGDVSCADLLGTPVSDLLAHVEGTLGGLVAGIVKTLDGAALLSVQDVKVAVSSTATDKVETSVADVTASIGSVKVGTLPIPEIADLDLTAPVATLDGAVAAIETQLDAVLGALNADLAGLVDIDVLDIEEIVGSSDAGVEALSQVTALRATITPPTGLLSAAAIDVTGTVSGILHELSTALPVLDPLMGQLEAALGGLDLITEETVLSLGTVSARSSFRPMSAHSTGTDTGSDDPSTGTSTGSDDSSTAIGATGTLPRTGADAAVPAMIAVALAGAAVAIRRLLRHATI